jgi:3-phosphoshikimate 1-carboxyvinyltransferase
MLRWLGVEVSTSQAGEAKVMSVSADTELTTRDIIVPADISSAAYFIAAAAMLPGSAVSVTGVGLNQSRKGIIDVLRDAGADVQVENVKEVCNEPVGTIRVRGISISDDTDTVCLSGAVIPVIIDELPILAVFGTQLPGGLEVRDAGELRAKETDRIAAVVENLRRMGADVEEFDDGFKVGRSELKGAAIDSFGDHRIAMAFAVAALTASGDTDIAGADCVDISFPGFFDILERSVERTDG